MKLIYDVIIPSIVFIYTLCNLLIIISRYVWRLSEIIRIIRVIKMYDHRARWQNPDLVRIGIRDYTFWVMKGGDLIITGRAMLRISLTTFPGKMRIADWFIDTAGQLLRRKINKLIFDKVVVSWD